MSVCVLSRSFVSDSATAWTAARQAPLSMGFSRQECWSGLPFPPPGDLPQPGIELCLLHWQADSLPLSHLGIPLVSGEAVISTVYFLRGWGRWGAGVQEGFCVWREKCGQMRKPRVEQRKIIKLGTAST